MFQVSVDDLLTVGEPSLSSFNAILCHKVALHHEKMF